MKKLLIAALVMGGSIAHADAPIWTSCDETVTGKMAIVLPPELKGNDEAIIEAVADCRKHLKSGNAIRDMVREMDSRALIPPPTMKK